MTLVIMAAGMGSRFGGLKQIEPVGPNGEFIIDYSIYDAIKAGFTKVVFIIKKENYEVFKETIGKRIESKIKVEYAFQENSDIPEGYNVPSDRVKPFGTGHALYCARNNIKEPFMVISADDFYGSEPFKLVKDSLDKKEYSIIGYEIGNTLTENGSVKRGVCFANGDILDKIVESKVEKKGNKVVGIPLEGGAEYEVDLDHPVSMLMYGLMPELIDFIKEDIKLFFEKNKEDLSSCEYYLPTLLNDYKNKYGIDLKLIKTKAVWKGITYKEDLDDLKEYIKEEIKNEVYPEKLYK